MTSSRFRTVRASGSWNPADHPRDPMGMFAIKGGGKGKGGPQPKLRGSSVLDSDLSVITPKPNPWGNFPSPTPSEVAANDARFAAQQARQAAYEQELRGEPVDLPMPPRPGWDDPSWRGVSAASVERELVDMYDPEAGVGLIDRRPITGGGMAVSVERAQIEGPHGYGSQVIIKRAATIKEADAEILGAEVGHAIGAPSPVVVGNPADRREIAMERVIGSMGHDRAWPTLRDGGREMVQNHREGGARIAVMDQITGNRDRHDSNWISTDDGTPVGIDNGLAFGGADERYRSVEEIRRVQSEFMGKMNQQVADWSQWSDRISDDEIESWGPRLMSLRPAFIARGRKAWHDQMMANYADILYERHEER